ncbi:MAG TPA: hypothetical protein VHL11_12025, partial [Phototrophicaceae bacterium]|nr:hypothetical protein [Phototrophicaceae bacterium]
MRKISFALILSAFSALLMIAPTLLPVLAQDVQPSEVDDNLLANPGFEQPFNDMTDVMPRQVADGWTPWDLGTSTDQPEYAPASVLNANRILSGADAQKMNFFSPSNAVAAGVYQTVSGLEPGTGLTFTVNVYVYSSATGENPDVSDTPDGIIVEVGIDPTGGTDPQSPAVLWSDPDEQYDIYHPVTIAAVVEGDAATVFVRADVEQARLLTEVYFDDASLIADAGPVTTEEPGATDEPTAEAPQVTEEPTVTETVEISTAEIVPTETATPIPPIDIPTEDTGATQTADAVNAQATIDGAATGTAIFETVVAQATGGALTNVALLTATQQQLDLTATANVILMTNAAVAGQVDTLNQTITAQALAIEQTSQAPTGTAVVLVITTTPEPPTEVVIDPTPTQPEPTTAPIEPTATPFDQPTTVPGEPTAVIPLSETFPGRLVHTVQNGETVSYLSALYGSSNDAIIAA